MSFDQWFALVNEAMIRDHYHAVTRDSSLVDRLYRAEFAPSDAVEVLHSQWVIEANIFAAKLLEQTIQGVQYTVWHEYLARTQHRSQ